MQVTVFPTVRADALESHDLTWHQLIEQCKALPVYPTKQACPLIKLATFGELRTNAGALRHDSNVMTVCGIEADYDAEAVSAESAAAMRGWARSLVYLHPMPGGVGSTWCVAGTVPRLLTRVTFLFVGIFDGTYSKIHLEMQHP